MPENYKLMGYDTFSSEWYQYRGEEFKTLEEARRSAALKLADLEAQQPSSGSGGQNGIQDQVFIVHPDGQLERCWPGGKLENEGNPINMQKLRLQNALDAIHGERAYQEKKWPGHAHTVGEWLLIIGKLLMDAKIAYFGHGENRALHEVRQIAATSLACLEQRGAPKRGEK